MTFVIYMVHNDDVKPSARIENSFNGAKTTLAIYIKYYWTQKTDWWFGLMIPISNKDFVSASGYEGWFDIATKDENQPPDGLKKILLPYMFGITSGTSINDVIFIKKWQIDAFWIKSTTTNNVVTYTP